MTTHHRCRKTDTTHHDNTTNSGKQTLHIMTTHYRCRKTGIHYTCTTHDSNIHNMCAQHTFHTHQLHVLVEFNTYSQPWSAHNTHAQRAQDTLQIQTCVCLHTTHSQLSGDTRTQKQQLAHKPGNATSSQTRIGYQALPSAVSIIYDVHGKHLKPQTAS